MTNKEEILNEIKKTEEHLANMKKMLAECEYEGWKPKNGDEYWYINENYKAINLIFSNTPFDSSKINDYNCFQTQEQAEAEAEKILVRRMLEDIARRLDKGVKIDWNNAEQPKHYIALYWDTIVINSYLAHKVQGVVYCLDKNFKDVAIQEIGEERLKKYLGGE